MNGRFDGRFSNPAHPFAEQAVRVLERPCSNRMDELGQILSQARENKGLTVEDVQQATRINAHYIEALENGEYEVLPTPVHVRGFLRNYARYLSLDPAPLLERYETYQSQQPLPPPAYRNGSRAIC